ncbi:MAG: amino acid permease, partial [Planctomycetaceae bacterium]
MMGSGIFTLLGLAGRTAGPLIPVAFLVAAIAASFSVYSYARLGGAFPSRGGAAGFLRAGLGTGVLSGGLNLFQYLGYLFATAL